MGTGRRDSRTWPGGRYAAVAFAAASLAQCHPHEPPTAAKPASRDRPPAPRGSATLLAPEPPPSPITVLRGDAVDLCVALANGHARCWGDNRDGKLGFAGQPRDRGPYRPMEGPTPLMDLAAGEHAVDFAMSDAVDCALLSSGRLRCFGRAEGDSAEPGDGGRGHGNATAASWNVGAGQSAIGLAAGPSHFWAVLADGHVACWGKNDHGQLGLGDHRSRRGGAASAGEAPSFVDLGSGRRARAVSAGEAFSCALLEDGHVKCWGEGHLLGLGSRVDRGGAPGEMGDALPDVDIGAATKVLGLSSGPLATCALLATGKVACWGEVPDTRGPCRVHVVGDELGEMGRSLAPVALTGRATAVAVASRRACALLEGGRMQCWAWDPSVRIPDGSWSMDRCGGVAYVGFGDGRSVRGLSAGPHGTCALLDREELICWEWSSPGVVPAVDFGD